MTLPTGPFLGAGVGRRRPSRHRRAARLGADRRLLTKEGETARDIARSRHPEREDLHYILSPSTRSLAQLLRKLIAERTDLFSDYDGNRLICDRLITCLGETWHEADALATRDATEAPVGLEARLEAALYAITGLSLPPRGTAQFIPAEHFRFSAAADFVRRTLLPPLRDLAARAALIPLEPHWAVLADLFEPAPDQWGLRGDLFLWMELRQVLCLCELCVTPDRDRNAQSRIGSWLPSPRSPARNPANDGMCMFGATHEAA